MEIPLSSSLSPLSRMSKSLNNFVSEVIDPCRLYTQKFVVTPLLTHTVNFPIWCQVFR